MRDLPSTTTGPAAPGPVDRGGGPTRRGDDRSGPAPARVRVLAADPAGAAALVAAIVAATGNDALDVEAVDAATILDPAGRAGPAGPDAGEAELFVLDQGGSATGRDGAIGRAGAAAIDLSLLQALRHRQPEVPTLVVVPPPPAAAGWIRAALAAGATEVIGAPPDPAELRLRLRTVLASRRDRDRLLRHDALTGLPNRDEFLRRTRRLFETAAAAGSGPAQRTLLVLNLDRFKPVNAGLGHAAGDALLAAVAARLVEIVARHDSDGRRDGDGDGEDAARSTPWVARLDSDGFVALLRGGRGDARLEDCLARITAGFERAHAIAGRELVVHASIGLATCPQDGTDAADLLRRATLAMEYAKRRGGRRVVWFDGVVERRAADRLLTEQQLRRAIGAGELRLWYQPKVDCATLALVGAEALVRWQHPERGLIGPQWFVPVAEASGLIVELGDWVVNEACRQGQAWRQAGLPPIHLAANVSAGQTRRGDLVATVRDALARTGYPPARLTLELTESLLIADDDATNRMIAELRGLGVALSIDDFGTGFASMTMLRRFAFDEIKIDRSFIRGLPGRRDGAAITRAIATLAGDLGLAVVAEGVETTDELAFLRQFPGCRFQGDLFSKPVDAPTFTAMLGANPGRPPAGAC